MGNLIKVVEVLSLLYVVGIEYLLWLKKVKHDEKKTKSTF